MEQLILDVDAAASFVSVHGNTQYVWRSRRTAIYLRDYLKRRLFYQTDESSFPLLARDWDR